MASPVAPVHYHVSMPEPISHEFEVTIDVPALADRASLDLVFPAWAPGSYLVRDFVRHVYDLTITDGRGRALPFERQDKQRWRVSTGGAALRVRYRVFAFEPSVRTSFLDDARGFGNGTSLFFYVEGEQGRPCVLAIGAPEGWHVSTALEPLRGKRHSYRAAHYDELVDSPFEVGTHQRRSFRVGRVRFEVAFYGRTNADLGRLVGELGRIASACARLFGGLPFSRYLFIIHALPARGGGLEHAASCTLDIAGMSFEDEKGYQDFAELAAHELFHAWNVKRIHDRVLGPFDYTRENYTRLLWFHEGFTEYMESIILLRAGLLGPKRYLADLADSWRKYVARPGRNVTPVAELSFEAWIKQYKPADNHINRMVSYYEKGKWAAVVLEILLREATHGRRGVEDLFRVLWDRFGRAERGITTDDVREAAESLAGRSLRSYFARYIDGTAELPVPLLLRRAGVAVSAEAPWATEDDATQRERQRAWAGLSFGGPAAGSDRAVLRNVVPGSPAWKAGLSYGDELVAIDEQRVTTTTAAKRLGDRRPGQRIRIGYFRQETLRTAELVLGRNPDRKWEFSIAPAAAAGPRAIRRGWLGA